MWCKEPCQKFHKNHGCLKKECEDFAKKNEYLIAENKNLMKNFKDRNITIILTNVLLFLEENNVALSYLELVLEDLLDNHRHNDFSYVTVKYHLRVSRKFYVF